MQYQKNHSYEFIDVLKAAAAILITNSHYADIWPISSLAFGGLLGDVMFFAASGFCLTGIRERFPAWYLRRIIRIYPTLWIAAIASLVIGFFQIGSMRDFIRYFIYPTYYHFIASIMLLYIVYYILIRLHRKCSIDLGVMMAAVLCVYLACYLLLFDRSYYHIDVVEEYMVRFLFLESMLLGAWLRERAEFGKLQFCLNKRGQFVLVAGMLVLYLASKLLFSNVEELSALQILNPLVLYLLLVSIMRLLCSWETRVEEKEENAEENSGNQWLQKIVRGGVQIPVPHNT